MNRGKITAVICSLGKETLGQTDPPAMNLNKVRESATDYCNYYCSD